MTADSVPAPMVQVPADTVDKLREATSRFGKGGPVVASGERGRWSEIVDAARAVVDAASPAASVPAADILALAADWESKARMATDQANAMSSDRRQPYLTDADKYRRRASELRALVDAADPPPDEPCERDGHALGVGGLCLKCGRGESSPRTNAAAEQADKGEAADTPRSCGHPNHGSGDHSCTAFSPAPDDWSSPRCIHGVKVTMDCDAHTCTPSGPSSFRCACEIPPATAPGAPPEPLCRCGHTQTKHEFSRYECGTCGWIGCKRFTRDEAAAVPVSDEAEVEEAAWHEWNRWGESVTQTPMIREAHRAGFRAARGGGNSDERP